MIALTQLLTAFILGALLVYFTIPVIVRISKAKNLFDIPNERKVTKKVIPNLGGIAIFIGISIATLLPLGNLFYPEFRSIIIGMIILLFIGIKDDIMIISARKKFVAQIICALILIIAGNIRFTNLHGILGIYEIDYGVSMIISTLAIVAIINALNLIDGIDGLAASIGILTSAFFGFLFLSMEQINYSILCFAISGSLFSFFVYNVFGKKNKIFMGDTGSLIIGLLVSVFVIKYNEFALSENVLVSQSAPALTMAIISIPLFDMIRVFCIRIMQKKSPVFPDMNHIHHTLLRLGYSHLKSTLILVAANFLLIGLVYLSVSFDNNIQLAMLLSFFILLTFIPNFIFRFKHYINSLPQKQLSNIIFEDINNRSRKVVTNSNYSMSNRKSKEKIKEGELEEVTV